jgi:hypothetical protein
MVVVTPDVIFCSESCFFISNLANDFKKELKKLATICAFQGCDPIFPIHQ